MAVERSSIAIALDTVRLMGAIAKESLTHPTGDSHIIIEEGTGKIKVTRTPTQFEKDWKSLISHKNG